MSNSLNSVSEYFPGREALFIQIEMSGYLIDYYLHRKDHAAATSRAHDEVLKELIACFAVHLVLSSPGETHAWTVHLISEQPFSLFVTGSAGALDELGEANGFIVGHVLTEHIRHTDVNSLHAQFSNRKGTHFKSYVKSESSEIPSMIESYYQQSEQLPLRMFLPSGSDTALALSALPGYDKEWFDSVSLEALAAGSDDARKRMRVCKFKFACDCSPEKLLPFFSSLSEEALGELYGEDRVVNISCPRCGRQFQMPRSEIEAWAKNRSGGSKLS